MINIVYLVLVLTNGTGGVASQVIPQANMAQCQANAKHYDGVGRIIDTHCIVGVMPK